MVNFTRLRIAFWAAVICASIMLFEDIGESFGLEDWIDQMDEFHIWEVLILGSLLLSIGLVGLEVYRLKLANDTLEERANRAAGAFQDLLAGYFDQWEFSPAERDVTRLML